MKKYFLFGFVGLLGGLVALGGAAVVTHQSSLSPLTVTAQPASNIHFANYAPSAGGTVADFTFAANKALPVVVNIQSSIRARGRGAMPFDLNQIPEPFRQFFGGREFGGEDQLDGLQKATGSGVILSPDGYIVTNNHVVADAQSLTVTLNDKRTYTATVIGTDPSTDLALIKIDQNGLPFMQFSNSNDIKVGEWVVAVGNPFNLASTVTAGIVSAKGRDLHIVKDKAPIESFIQTDAVVNPGNSGGALVNLNGDLIGINTAIASPTGVFAGYAFAIPSNLVQKIVEDLKHYGVAQRGYLGVVIHPLDPQFAKEKNINTINGVYVDSLQTGSAAAAAGVKAGDVITKVDGQGISTSSDLLAIVGSHRPGDRLNLTLLRDGQERELAVTLKNRSGNTDTIKKSAPSAVLETLGADFQTLSKEEAQKWHLDGGVKLTDLQNGKLAQQTDIREGFIITKANKTPVKNVEDLTRQLQNSDGGILLEGVYPGNPGVFYYALGM